MGRIVNIVDLNCERQDEARSLGFEQRFLAGAELFDRACEVARSHLSSQHPDWTVAQIDQEIRRRMDVSQRLRERR